MLTRSLRFAYARQTALSLGWLVEGVAIRPSEGLALAPRLSLVARDATQGTGRVEVVSAEAMAGRRAAWADLVLRCLEPNVFLEPDFALPAAQHIVSVRRPVFLLVSDPTRFGKSGELIGLFALHLPRSGGHGIAKAWCNAQAALGLPLLDRGCGGEALDTMLDWLAREQPGVGAVLFPCMPSEGPVMRLIEARAGSGQVRLVEFDRRARALLNGDSDVQALLSRRLSPKRLKEIRRKRRRLAEAGELIYVRSEAADVRAATEHFLALEVSGWKGARGTALLKDPGLATFTRSMTRLLARNGKCHIDSLELDGRPLAMGIVLTSGKEAFLWKIAYDEHYATFSPGVQFIIEFMRRQTADHQIARTDSCAIPNHPMLDRLWPDRIEIADVLLAPSSGREQAFADAALREKIRRRVRAAAKRAYYAAIGSRPS